MKNKCRVQSGKTTTGKREDGQARGWGNTELLGRDREEINEGNGQCFPKRQRTGALQDASRLIERKGPPPGFGLRQPSGAFLEAHNKAPRREEAEEESQKVGKSESRKERVEPLINANWNESEAGKTEGKIMIMSKSKIKRGWSRLWRAVAGSGVALGLAGCVMTPQTTIQGTLNGSPFVIKAPKDGELAGFDLSAESNGVVRVHIEHLSVKMNPDVIGQSGAAQREMIQAAGEAAAGITAAAVREGVNRR